MENFEFDSEMGGYVILCDRCGTAKGVRSNYLCDPCDKVWNSDEGPRSVLYRSRWDDHLEPEPGSLPPAAGWRPRCECSWCTGD